MAKRTREPFDFVIGWILRENQIRSSLFSVVTQDQHHYLIDGGNIE